MSDQRTTTVEITPLTNTEPEPVLQLAGAPFAMRYIAALLMTALATVAAVGIDTTVTIPNLSLIFVIPVIAAAVVFGLGPSLFSAVLGALAFNYFLTEPRYSLAVDDPANVWAIALLFACGCIASAVASTARRKADDVELLQRQTEALQGYGRAALRADSPKAIVATAARALETIFRAPAVVMIRSGAAVVLLEKRGDLELTEPEFDASRASLTSGGPVRAGVYPFDTSRFDFWPVPVSGGRQAVIGLAFDPDERPAKPDVFVEPVASILALALERQPSSPGAASL
jgi:two-component system sensor histidine kinase KdpD